MTDEAKAGPLAVAAFPEPSEEAEVSCPSGLRVKMRAMRVREEDLLADKKLAREQRVFDELLTRCILEVLDPGPYGHGAWRFSADDLYIGDHFFLCVALRIMSYGNEFEFKTTAPSGKNISVIVDLRDLDVKPMSPETREAIMADRAFETFLPRCGKKVRHKLLRRRALRHYLKRVAAEQGQITSALMERVIEVDGVDEPSRRPFIESLQAFDAATLRQDTEAVDFGVDTAATVEDPETGDEFSVELQVSQSFFSLPSRSRARTS